MSEIKWMPKDVEAVRTFVDTVNDEAREISGLGRAHYTVMEGHYLNAGTNILGLTKVLAKVTGREVTTYGAFQMANDPAVPEVPSTTMSQSIWSRAQQIATYHTKARSRAYLAACDAESRSPSMEGLAQYLKAEVEGTAPKSADAKRKDPADLTHYVATYDLSAMDDRDLDVLLRDGRNEKARRRFVKANPKRKVPAAKFAKSGATRITFIRSGSKSAA